MDNPYKILGLDENATDEEIKKAYRDSVKKYHPDNTNEAGSKEKFVQITKAYEKLISQEKQQNADDLWWEQVQKDASDFSQRNVYDNQTQSNTHSSFEQSIYDDTVNSHFEIYLDEYINLDEYIKFLDENEERANKCGMSLKNLKKAAYNMNPMFAFFMKDQIEEELNEMESKCKKFDYFMEFEDKTYKEKERQEKLKLLRYRLITERGIAFDDYLEIRNYNFSNVPYKVIEADLNFLNLINEIEKQLLSFGITIDNLLDSLDKNLIEVEYNELVRIENIISTLKDNGKTINVENITQIYYNEQNETKKK